MANIIGDNINTLRDGMGFNQSNIARFLNVDQSLISKVEKELGTSGRLLVRYSGTENKLRVMLEGKDEQVISTYAKEIADTAVNEIKGKE